MARDEAPPFSRGETFYNGGTIDSNNLGGSQHEGKEWVFEDLDYASSNQGVKPARTNRSVTCRCVRNVAATALLPKWLARFQNTAGGARGGKVDGRTRLNAEDFAGVVDEFLPAAGVPVNDLFWLAVAGPSEILTPLDAGAANVFAVGNIVVAHTAATSGATSAGRVIAQDLTGATAPLGNNVQHRVGHALSARTTAETNVGLLVDLFRRW